MTALGDRLTDVAGLRVGHWSDAEAVTGCTVVLCDSRAVAAVDVAGGAPGTRETDLLRPGSLVTEVDAVVLAGGSAYGLAACTGVMRYLEEHGQGHATAAGVVPIVPGAILFDLGLGSSQRRPDAAAGYAACQAASTDVPQGSVGAGTGATVAKAGGIEHGWKSGIGTASAMLGDGTIVAALVAVNAFGDVYDESGLPLATSRNPRLQRSAIDWLRYEPPVPSVTGNTTIGVVATDATLSREEAVRLARMAQNGVALGVRPAHTPVDGDVLFALGTGQRPGPAGPMQLSALGALASEVVWRAIAAAVRHATSLGGYPAIAGGQTS